MFFQVLFTFLQSIRICEDEPVPKSGAGRVVTPPPSALKAADQLSSTRLFLRRRERRWPGGGGERARCEPEKNPGRTRGRTRRIWEWVKKRARVRVDGWLVRCACACEVCPFITLSLSLCFYARLFICSALARGMLMSDPRERDLASDLGQSCLLLQISTAGKV